MRRFAFLLWLTTVLSLACAVLVPSATFAAPVASEASPDGDESKSNGDQTPDQQEESKLVQPDEAEQPNANKAEEKPAADEKKSTDAEAEKKESQADKPADESKPKQPDAKTDAAKRKTFTVEPKRLKLEVTLDGTFVAHQMEEVALRPETWTNYEIVEVVEHGTKVRKGETLIKFDPAKLDEAIADLELEQRLNELAILRTEEELPRLEKSLRLDLEDAERASQQAKEDFERYKEIDRPMMVKTAEFMVKYYDFMLNYEKDELEQLEKMYEADDLTEETEEIILKRQRNSVEFAEFSLENAKLSRDRTLNIRLPRLDEEIKNSLERADLAKARARMAVELDLNRARYELEQRKKARAKSLDRHAKLLADRALMEIKAPADGIVFYGQNINGRWADTQNLINKYKPHNNASPGAVLFTIVQSRPLFVISAVDEGKRPDVSDGQKAKLALPAEGAERVAATVKSISPIPVSPGKFEITFDAEQDQLPDWVTPGMSCKIQITTYDKKDALVVPKAAVRDDEDDEDIKYVWVVDPEDEQAKPQRRNVKLGKRKGDEVEIVKGLKKGDVISLDDESKKDDAKKQQ